MVAGWKIKNIHFQAAQTLSICTQNLAKIMGNVDPNQTIVNKSVPALIDWGQ